MNLFNKIKNIPKDKRAILITLINKQMTGHILMVEGRVHFADMAAYDLEEVKKVANLGVGLHILGESKYFVDTIQKDARLVVCGGGYVSQALVKVVSLLDFKIIGLEDRINFAQALKDAGANEVMYDNFNTSLDMIEGDLDTYFAIITRGHRYDTDCLRRILLKPNAYIGMISSKFRAATTKKGMIKEGYDKQLVDSIHAPIGLSIGGQTPEEIAVSIAAEIISVKNANKTSGGFSQELLEDFEKTSKRVVLATIMTRQGSSPRDVGTKMLIFEDGSVSGTIGGGCAEADIRTQAQDVLLSGKPKFYKIDMTASNINEEEGMICGGIMDVYLEEVKRY